jgi:HEAT repeat protein
MRWRLAALSILVASVASAQSDTERAADEGVLRSQQLPTSGAELLAIRRDRTPTPEIIERFDKQVRRLKSAAYVDRHKATAELTKMGPVVRPLLDNLLRDIHADPETVSRLRHVLEKFPADKDAAATSAAARLIARDKLPNSLPTLFAFAPYVSNESVRQDIQAAINAVSYIDKKPVSLILNSLKDANPARRAAAAEALVRAGKPAADYLAPLLADADPLVRYQLGTALIEKNDKRGVRMLIDSLEHSTPERIENAVELLSRVAGEHAPDVYYQGKHSVAALSAAWRKWQTNYDGDLDLAKALARTELGFTVITTSGIGVNVKNKIFELGPPPEQAIRWQFDGPRNPLDVQIIGPDRLLVVEYLDQRITERDFKGTVLKQFTASLPVACQRLPNGQTFIVTRRMLKIVDAEGKDVFTWMPQPPNITTATRLRNGQIAVVTSGGKCQLLDAKGQELKSFLMGGVIYVMGGNIDILPNGKVLAPLYNLNTIVEFDWAGNKHWQANINRPTSVSRLANGNTLVTCSFDSRVVELDRNGAEVWSYRTEGRPFRARRR